ncbi:MAG: hypothetical protein ACRDTF_20855 [Pseudonocardiaceae bacterium]
MIKNAVRAATAVMTALMLTAGAAAVATATPVTDSSAAQESSKTASRPMTIAGFDPAVAEANGYEIRTDAQGRQYSVKRGTLTGAEPLSEGGGRVDGDCGFSFVKINGIGNNTARLETGFGVRAPVNAYEWHVSIIDTRGVSTQDWGPVPGPGTPGLTLVRDLPGLATGEVDAQVLSSSRVMLSDGAFCYSGGPRDTGFVF